MWKIAIALLALACHTQICRLGQGQNYVDSVSPQLAYVHQAIAPTYAPVPQPATRPCDCGHNQVPVSPPIVSPIIPQSCTQAPPAITPVKPAKSGLSAVQPQHGLKCKDEANSHEGKSRQGKSHEDKSHEGCSHEGRSHQGRSHEGRSHEGRSHQGKSHEERSSEQNSREDKGQKCESNGKSEKPSKYDSSCKNGKQYSKEDKVKDVVNKDGKSCDKCKGGKCDCASCKCDSCKNKPPGLIQH